MVGLNVELLTSDRHGERVYSEGLHDSCAFSVLVVAVEVGTKGWVRVNIDNDLRLGLNRVEIIRWDKQVDKGLTIWSYFLLVICDIYTYKGLCRATLDGVDVELA